MSYWRANCNPYCWHWKTFGISAKYILVKCSLSKQVEYVMLNDHNEPIIHVHNAPGRYLPVVWGAHWMPVQLIGFQSRRVQLYMPFRSLVGQLIVLDKPCTLRSWNWGSKLRQLTMPLTKPLFTLVPRNLNGSLPVPPAVFTPTWRPVSPVIGPAGAGRAGIG